MGKLHELLAVEADLKAKAQSAIARIKHLFGEGQGRLVGQSRTYSPLLDGGEPLPNESTELATTIADEIRMLRDPVMDWIDAAIQKEVTNQRTNAEIVLNGKAVGLPAPALLNLEAKLAELRQIVDAVPVNNPSESWTWDAQVGHYVSRERVTYRTQKVTKPVVLYEATKEHPAQVQAVSEDIRVGAWRTVIHSGMISPTRKSEWLNRIDALIRAVKQARQRANDIQVEDVHVGASMFDHIFRE